MKSPILGLALSTVAFGASSIYLWTQLNEQRDLADAVRKRNAELTSRIVALEKMRNDFIAHPMSFPGKFGDPVRAGAVPDATNPPSPTDGRQVFGAVTRDFRNPPAMPEAMVRMMRANIRAQNKRLYFDLQSKLGLTDDQTNDLLDLLAEQHSAGFKGPRNPDPEAARDYWEDEQAKRKAAIEDLLGTSKAAQFEDYQKSMPSRSELMMISQQLDGVDLPLTDAQRSRLLDAMVEERERIPVPTYSDATPQEDMMKTYNDWQSDYEKRVADQARGILTSEQLSTYNEYQTWQQEMRRQFATQGVVGPRMGMSGNAAFIAPGASFAVAVDSASSSPTEKPASAK